MDQLQYHLIRSLELDIFDYKQVGLGRRRVKGDWFVYHDKWMPAKTTCNMLSDCLQEFRAWSDANPQHEPVTIWIDLKEALHGSWSRSNMDKLLTNSGLDLFSPKDLLGEKTSLQEAASHGWPTESDLRGKVIIVFTDKSNSYCKDDETCEQAKAFRHCKTKDRHNFCVFFNENIDDTENNKAFSDLQNSGYVTRVYSAPPVITKKHDWEYAIFKHINHISTDNINFHEDPWAKTHNTYGGPFQYVNHQSMTPSQNRVIGIEVDSGDVWDSGDDFFFAYQEYYNQDQEDYMFTVASNNANSHVDDYTKGGLMVRESTNSRDAAFFAVLRTGDQELRVQYRTKPGDPVKKKTHDIAPEGIDKESKVFLKLTVSRERGTTVTTVEGYGSQDGKDWTLIHTHTFSRELEHVGLAASSHDDRNPDGTPIKYLFGNFEADGNAVEANNLSKMQVGTVKQSTLFDGIFAGSSSDKLVNNKMVD